MEQTRRRRYALIVLLGLAGLFLALAAIAVSLHQRAAAFEFVSTAFTAVPIGIIVLLVRPARRDAPWWNRPIRFDTRRRLSAFAVVLLAVLVGMFVLVGHMAGFVAAVIETGVFGVVLLVGFIYTWRRIQADN